MGFWSGATALVKVLASGWPWWACLVAFLACLAVYICRQWIWYRLYSKALDKVTPSRVPEVVAAFRPTTGRERHRSGTRATSRSPGDSEGRS